MFGSSQDRARQLAGRNRRERISSISSCSSARSMSFSSRPPQPRHTPPSELRTVKPTATIDESTSHEDTDASVDPIVSNTETCAVNGAFVSLSIPQLAEGLDCLQVEQHRVQTEHLSRVLHSNVTFPIVTGLPESQLALPRHTRYGSLGTHPATLQYPRSITAPIQTTHLSKSILEDLLALLDTTTAPPLRTSVSDHHLRSESTVSLRGGSGDYIGFGGYRDDHRELDIAGRDGPRDSDTPEQFALWALERHILKCMSPMDYPSYALACKQETLQYQRNGIPQTWSRINMAAWQLPITVGAYYNTFLQSLSTADLGVFVRLFRLLPVINVQTVSASNMVKRNMARLAFFHCLGHAGRVRFCNVLAERINLVLGSVVLPALSDATKPPIDTVHLFVTAELFVQLIPPLLLKRYLWGVIWVTAHRKRASSCTPAS
jgi:DCN1-like protein 1/2